jgi:BMFP domain-containing protein YqiC
MVVGRTLRPDRWPVKKACPPGAAGPYTLKHLENALPHAMTQTNNRLLDELAKMMTDAAGAAQGLKREVETMIRSQGEKWLREMDVVQREEFEAVKAMAEKARAENDELRLKLKDLEAKLEASQ